MKVVRADAEGERVTAEWLLQGGVAVVPTDTVYGLAARPAEVDAVRTIYRLKGRPEGMHLPVLAATVDQVRSLGVAFTPAAEALARRWWPGPLTLAFGFDPQRDRPDWLQGRTEVAVRIPAHDFLRAVLGQTGVLVVTSANPHGAPTPRTGRRRGGHAGRRRRARRRRRGVARRPLDTGQRQRASPVGGARGRHSPAGHRRRAAGGPVSRTLLAIETSCDETAAAVVDDALAVRSSVVASQIDLHAAFGGVVPELASRAHLETVTPIVARALDEAGISGQDLTAVAVTSGPGLVGALLVGIATAKALALGWGIPVVGVNHLEGHLASVYLADPDVPFPQTRSVGLGRPLHAHPLHGAGTLRAARRDRRRLHRRGLRQGGPLSRARIPRWAGPRPARRHRRGRARLPPAHARRGLHLLLLGAQDRSGQPRARRSRVLRESRSRRPSWPPAWTCSSPNSAARSTSSATPPWPSSAAWRRVPFCAPGPRCWPTSSAPGCSSLPTPWPPTTPP